MIFGEERAEAREVRATPLYGVFAERSAANEWTTINGYAFGRRFTDVAAEYEALTSGCAAVDLGVLRRYSLRGPQAGDALGRLASAPSGELRPGESGRGLMVSAAGDVVDLCEATRLAPEAFLLTTTGGCVRRVSLAVRGLDVKAEDISESVAALGLFGPGAKAAAAAAGFDVDVEGSASQVRVRGVESFARPTSLGRAAGLELIFPADEALAIWQRIFRAANPTPVGLDACEVVRLEGGTPRPSADFPRADDDPGGEGRSPVEIGLSHLAPVDKGWFTGRRALKGREQRYALLPALVDADMVAEGARAFIARPRSRGSADPGEPVGVVRSSRHSPFFRGAIAFVEIDLAAAGVAFDAETVRPIEGAALRVEAGDGLATANALETHEWRLAAAYRRRRAAATESGRRAV